MGRESHDQEQWRFPDVILSEDQKREIIATVVEIATGVFFDTHCYTFGGKRFLQSKGGPIGMRATCAIARLVMAKWDTLWEEKLQDHGIKLELVTRYMDDGRAMLHPIKAGWRWEGGELLYCQEWEDEDGNISPLERTRRVIQGSVGGILKGVELTLETADDFGGKWLPTLDVQLRVTEDKGRVQKLN